MTSLKALFLAANPQGTTPLALDQEIRQITQKIRLSDGRDVLEVVSVWAVQPSDLLQYLNQYKPHVVHFSGHGTAAGEIVLVDGAGAAKAVSARALRSLFATLKDNVQLVVLNACYSRTQGAAINEVIDFVIGMNTAIGDEAAIVFAASLYSALGFNRTVGEAFEQAKTALLLEGIPEENTPELLVRPGASVDRKLGAEQKAVPPTTIEKAKAAIGKPLRPGEAIPLLDELGRLNDSEQCRVRLFVRLANGSSFESGPGRLINGIYFLVHPITKDVNQPKPGEISEVTVLSVTE
jgi:hypothetical protein